MPKYQTSKLWKNPHQKEGKYFNYHQRELDLSIHQTLNKPMKLGRGTTNPEMNKAEDPSTKTQNQIHAPTKVDPRHEYCRNRTPRDPCREQGNKQSSKESPKVGHTRSEWHTNLSRIREGQKSYVPWTIKVWNSALKLWNQEDEALGMHQTLTTILKLEREVRWRHH